MFRVEKINLPDNIFEEVMTSFVGLSVVLEDVDESVDLVESSNPKP